MRASMDRMFSSTLQLAWEGLKNLPVRGAKSGKAVAHAGESPSSYLRWPGVLQHVIRDEVAFQAGPDHLWCTAAGTCVQYIDCVCVLEHVYVCSASTTHVQCTSLRRPHCP